MPLLVLALLVLPRLVLPRLVLAQSHQSCLFFSSLPHPRHPEIINLAWTI